MNALPSTDTPLLSGLVLARNEAARLEACLSSLAFCDDLVVVVDARSDDDTEAIARRLGARVFVRPFLGCNDQKEFGRTQCRGLWVLNLDADERIPQALQQEIRHAVKAANALEIQGFRIPVLTTLEGHDEKPLRCAGWFPNRQRRLFLRERGRWDRSTEPHDRVVLDGRWGVLRESIEHRPPGGLQALEGKARHYGDIAGRTLARSGSAFPRLRAWVAPPWRFLRAYLLQGGVFHGGFGFDLARLRYLEGRIKYTTWNKTRKG